MRISKTARWILTIGILAVLLGGLGVNYGRQMAEQRQLSADMSQAQQDFDEARQGFTEHTASYTAQKEDLEARLNQANSRIAGVQSEFRQYTESIEINEALFEAAEEANVTITKLTSSLPEEEELNGVTCQVFTLSITAKGELVALLNFSRKLSERFSTAAIESVKIDVPEEEEEEEESEEKPTSNLKLKIYAYESE